MRIFVAKIATYALLSQKSQHMHTFVAKITTYAHFCRENHNIRALLFENHNIHYCTLFCSSRKRSPERSFLTGINVCCLIIFDGFLPFLTLLYTFYRFKQTKRLKVRKKLKKMVRKRSGFSIKALNFAIIAA